MPLLYAMVAAELLTVDGALETIRIQPSSPAAGADPLVDVRAAEEQKPENRIEVGDQLPRPHPLVQATSAALSKFRSGERAAPASGNDRNKTEPVLDIRVSPAARHRVLRVVDALLKALEARAYQVNARGVTIEGQLLPIGVTEKDDQTPHVPTVAERAEKQRYRWTRISTWDYVPNGQLSIHTEAYVWWRKDLRKRWSDTRSVRLENKLNDVVVGLVALGAALRRRADEQRREAEARAEQERLRQERACQCRVVENYWKRVRSGTCCHLSLEFRGWRFQILRQHPESEDMVTRSWRLSERAGRKEGQCEQRGTQRGQVWADLT
jgi:hypothetical protein